MRERKARRFARTSDVLAAAEKVSFPKEVLEGMEAHLQSSWADQVLDAFTYIVRLNDELLENWVGWRMINEGDMIACRLELLKDRPPRMFPTKMVIAMDYDVDPAKARMKVAEHLWRYMADGHLPELKEELGPKPALSRRPA